MPVLEIEKIDKDFEHTGDVKVTSNIENNVTVIVKNGSLEVLGNICSGCTIKLESQGKSSTVVSGGTIFSFKNMSVSLKNPSLVVDGNIEENVKINTSNADIRIAGFIRTNSTISTISGNVMIGAIQSNVSLKTISGDVKVRTVSSNSSIRTVSGDIVASIVEAHASLKTTSGDVTAHLVHPSATISTVSGTIVKGSEPKSGIKKKNQGGTTITADSISISGGGSIFVNGRISEKLLSALSENENNSNSSSP